MSKKAACVTLSVVRSGHSIQLSLKAVNMQSRSCFTQPTPFLAPRERYIQTVVPVYRRSFAMLTCAPQRHASLRQLFRTCAFKTAPTQPDTNLDKAAKVVELLPQGKRWEQVDQWVMFSDLHVSVKTLSICLDVLRKVKHEATKRKAGVLFLGESATYSTVSHFCISIKHDVAYNMDALETASLESDMCA